MLLTNFNAFRDSMYTNTLDKPKSVIDQAVGTAYTVANRVAVVAAVLAVILCGISFVLGSSNKRDMSQNKTILTRVLLTTGLIFAAVAVVSLVARTSI